MWNLSRITTKVRDLTGTPISSDNSSELSDAKIYDYINTYYTFTMPFELKEQVTEQTYTFYTDENTPTYSEDITFLTNSPEAYVNGQRMVYYEDRDIFLRDYPQEFAQDAIATGDGIVTAYSGTTVGIPVIQKSFFISDGSQEAHDDGSGSLTGDVSAGVIDYDTGVWSATFNAAPAVGQSVIVNYEAYIPRMPLGILFYNSEFVLRPIPDQVYKIELKGQIDPIQFSASGDTPLLTEWGQLIAYGASLEIMADRGDLTAYNNMYNIFKRYENVALGRFIEQLQSQRGLPRF